MRNVWPLVLAIGCGVVHEAPQPTAAVTQQQPAAPSEQPALPPPSLTGLGKCKINHCTFELAQVATGDTTTVSRDRCDETVADCKPLQGTLTSAGLEKARELAARMDQAKLEEVYGCPGCADGLAYKIVLHHADGRVTKHSADPEYPQDLPPTLADAMAFGRALDDAVSQCKATALVTPNADCAAMLEKTKAVRMMVP